jgi:hypothetical protein
MFRKAYCFFGRLENLIFWKINKKIKKQKRLSRKENKKIRGIYWNFSYNFLLD